MKRKRSLLETNENSSRRTPRRLLKKQNVYCSMLLQFFNLNIYSQIILHNIFYLCSFHFHVTSMKEQIYQSFAIDWLTRVQMAFGSRNFAFSLSSGSRFPSRIIDIHSMMIDRTGLRTKNVPIVDGWVLDGMYSMMYTFCCLLLEEEAPYQFFNAPSSWPQRYIIC